MASKKNKSNSKAQRLIDKVLGKLPKNKFVEVVSTIVVVILVWVYCALASLLMALGALFILIVIGSSVFGGSEFQVESLLVGLGILVAGLGLARLYSKNVFEVFEAVGYGRSLSF